MCIQHRACLPDSDNSGQDQSKPCPFSFGSQDMFGVSGASEAFLSFLPSSLSLQPFPVRKGVGGGRASREEGGKKNSEKTQSLLVLPWPFTCRNGRLVVCKKPDKTLWSLS